MPERELRPYIARLAHVEAQRAFNQAERVAVGSGRLKVDDHKATITRWRHDLDVGPAARARDPEQLAAAAHESRIGFRTVKVR